MSASPDKQVSSEYLKRTCLICGCHTNQTINIYEPRSGPNIVQLIQAKFKFQPLNEDKYLCFSCNNWLINWHSLQAVNSNEAESPTHLNSSNNMVHDKACGGAVDKPPTTTQKQRPVATVRPRQLQAPAAAQITNEPMRWPVASLRRPTFSKRYFRHAGIPLHRFINEHKLLHRCSICGCTLILLLRLSNQQIKKASLKLAKQKCCKYARCRQCLKITNWRILHMKALTKSSNGNRKRSTSRTNLVRQPITVRLSEQNTKQNQSKHNESSTYQRRYQQPRVDGKVVAMFRRIGTTLSREAEPTLRVAPPIMSPVKQHARWTRRLEEDEILLEFNTAISEVLPTAAASVSSTKFRRKLNDQFTTAINESASAKLSSGKIDLQGYRLPQGLSITLA